MKQTNTIKPAMSGRKILTILFATMIALMAVVVGMFFVKSANAESYGSVTIHVYDSSEKYDSLAGWVWVKGGSGREFAMSATAAADEPFFKGNNKAHTLTVDLTENQVNALKGSSQMGMLVCVKKGNSGDFWSRYEKEGADVFVSLATAFDENNHADVYYVRKDTAAYTDLQEAYKALEKIISATFVAKTNTTATVRFESTTPLQIGAQATLYEDDKLVSTVDIKSSHIDSTNKSLGKVTFGGVGFDFSKDYTIKLSTLPNGSSVAKTGLIDTADFMTTYETKDAQAQEYGAIYTKEKTTFRLWAPFATTVSVNIFDNGSAGDALSKHKMRKRNPDNWSGVWEYELNGDQNGVYYTYAVVNNGVETETIDPYAKACGANGTRGMVVDLAATNPDGWEADKKWHEKHAVAVDTPIIWEVTIADFSSSSDSGMKYKGKYLAFTEQNTTVPGTDLKTGVNYLKDLGITYVHLNPVYDFATVDESDLTRADSGVFNWGYDPQNYNIPEGSYSTDPADGAVRINEFKRMVKALHDAGIGVVMDVVYNHTYSTSGQALHDTVPFYYHRTDENGAFTDASGCGNETASERTMMRKYIVESMKYWAEEYHIDGFRFDLMGIHDLDTVKAVRTTLDNLYGVKDSGKRILIYGEPWAADGSYVPASFKNRIAASKTGMTGPYAANSSANKLIKNMFAGYNNDYPRDMTELPDRVAVFNDFGREGLRGNNDPGKGWANGNYGMVGKVIGLMEGGAGGEGEPMKLGVGSRSVAYACAHDNYTLWDQIHGGKHFADSPIAYDAAIADDIKRCKLVASAYMMSTGMCFMIAGEEMGRTKYGNENSYNSPVKLNQIVWSRQADFNELYTYYKSLIKLRRDYSTKLFSYSQSTQAEFCWGSFGDGLTNYSTGYFKFTRTKNGTTLTLELNASTLSGSVKIGTAATLTI